jgi:hypothetical protein
MRMRIRILPFTLMRFWIRILASKQRLKALETGLKQALFSHIWACHLQIDADPNPAYHFEADVEGSYLSNDADPRRSTLVFRDIF